MYLWKSNILFPSVGCAKKQTSVCHRSTESEIISPDAGLGMDGIFALDLWVVVIEVLHSSKNVPPSQNISSPKCEPKGAAGNCRHLVSGLVNFAMQPAGLPQDDQDQLQGYSRRTRSIQK